MKALTRKILKMGGWISICVISSATFGILFGSLFFHLCDMNGPSQWVFTGIASILGFFMPMVVLDR